VTGIPGQNGGIDHLEAIVFDFDGLILDTESSWYAATAAIFEAYDVELDRTWVDSILGSSDHRDWVDVLEELIGAPVPDAEDVRARRNAHHHALVAEERVRPGVTALLEAATDAAIPLGVASSSSLDWVDEHLVRLGLRGHFVAVLTRDDVAPGRTKPAPDLYAAAVAALGVDPTRAVALEDSPNGVAAAKAAGLTALAVPGPMTAHLDFSAADRVVESLEAVTLPDLADLAVRSAP
jgi:HAD superfamily hydrolase (TIGR01509 family)